MNQKKPKCELFSNSGTILQGHLERARRTRDTTRNVRTSSCILCMSAVADFQAFRYERARSIHYTLQALKCCPELIELGSSCHAESVQVHRSLEKNVNDRLKDLFPCQNTSL